MRLMINWRDKWLIRVGSNDNQVCVPIGCTREAARRSAHKDMMVETGSEHEWAARRFRAQKGLKGLWWR